MILHFCVLKNFLLFSCSKPGWLSIHPPARTPTPTSIHPFFLLSTAWIDELERQHTNEIAKNSTNLWTACWNLCWLTNSKCNTNHTLHHSTMTALCQIKPFYKSLLTIDIFALFKWPITVEQMSLCETWATERTERYVPLPHASRTHGFSMDVSSTIRVMMYIVEWVFHLLDLRRAYVRLKPRDIWPNSKMRLHNFSTCHLELFQGRAGLGGGVFMPSHSIKIAAVMMAACVARLQHSPSLFMPSFFHLREMANDTLLLLIIFIIIYLFILRCSKWELFGGKTKVSIEKSRASC